MSSEVMLVFGALALLGVVAAQDWLIPGLRKRPISDGLAGKMHGWLDGAYVLLIVAILWNFYPKGGWTAAFALIGAIGLFVSGVSATLANFTNKISDNQHALIHTVSTAVTFFGAFGVTIEQDGGWLWGLTVLGLLGPAMLTIVLDRTDLAEKFGVGVLCVWLIAWAV